MSHIRAFTLSYVMKLNLAEATRGLIQKRCS